MKLEDAIIRMTMNPGLKMTMPNHYYSGQYNYYDMGRGKFLTETGEEWDISRSRNCGEVEGYADYIPDVKTTQPKPKEKRICFVCGHEVTDDEHGLPDNAGKVEFTFSYDSKFCMSSLSGYVHDICLEDNFNIHFLEKRDLLAPSKSNG